jgi:hypothetical protein
MVVLAFAGSAYGKIGETSEQVIARSKRNAWGDIIGIESDRWQNKPLVHVHYRDGAIVSHVFGVNGRQIAMLSYAPKRFTDKDIVEIQGLYRTTWRPLNLGDDIPTWESSSGLIMSNTRRVGHDLLAIVDVKKSVEINDYIRWLGRNLDVAPAPEPEPEPEPESKPEQAKPSKFGSKDCLLVATEAYSRLKNTAYWARIGKFVILKDGKIIGGHAATFFQPTQNSNVFMYDKEEGSCDLRTKSHELPTLELALRNVYNNGYAARSVGWIEN